MKTKKRLAATASLLLIKIMKLIAYIGQQRNDARAFDGDGQFALMLCAGAGHPAGQDLAALGYKAF